LLSAALMIHIAIVGSGPAGCYLADHLLKLIPEASIDVIERLPVPFGLIRYGVSPDHQSTKAVSRLFDRVLSRDHVGYFGNVEIGRDLGLDELTPLYDAVVLATGAPVDRRLGIPGEDLPGVVASGAFVNWYNSHPHSEAPVFGDVRSAVIIGNGNVAIDVTRILAKGPDEFAGSDVAPAVASWLSAQPIESIHLVGRRGAADTKFNHNELAELGTLRRARPVVSDPAGLVGDGQVLTTLRGFAGDTARNTPVTINFHFNLTPTAFVGDDRLREVQFRSAQGETVAVPAELAVTCIGYEARGCGGLELVNGLFANQDGKIGDGLYVVGWAKRGPSGIIPTNRVEAQQVAQKMVQEVADNGRPGGQGLRQLLQERQLKWVDYEGWRSIDLAEVACAGAERCREKFSTTIEMLDAAQAGQIHST
jgi:NADPH-dependent glutamate synthase beta subunit-like oxidoreductase